jgi:hypothetical protein
VIADSLLPDMRDEHSTKARPWHGHHTPYPSYRWPVSYSCAGVWEALHHLWPHCRTSRAAARQRECPGSGMVGVAGCCAPARAGVALVASPAHAINLSSLSPPPTAQTPLSVLFPRSEQSLHLFLTRLLLQRFLPYSHRIFSCNCETLGPRPYYPPNSSSAADNGLRLIRCFLHRPS